MDSSSPPYPPNDAIDEDIEKLEAQIKVKKKGLSSIQKQLNTLDIASKEDKTCKSCDKRSENLDQEMLKLMNPIKNSESNASFEKFQKIVDKI